MEAYLQGIGVHDVPKAIAALAGLGVHAPSDFDSLDLDGPLETELRDGLKDAGISLGDRGKILKACKDAVAATKLKQAVGSGVAAQHNAAPPISSSEPLPLDVKKLRPLVAALDSPDEGMRGTAADVVKLRVTQEPPVLMALATALRGRVPEAATAAAVVRSIAITPTAVASICGAAVGIPSALMQAAATRPVPVRAWALPAMARLAQHRESHPHLLAAGAEQALISLARAPRDAQLPNVRLDLVAVMALAFLSESTGQATASQVPLRAVPELVNMLRKRLFAKDAAETVSSRVFCGLPLDYRPRFVCQALTRLAEHSSAHAAVAWNTALPELLCGILDGIIPGDTDKNAPWGSPDVSEMGRSCAHALLARPAGDDDARAALSSAAGPPPERPSAFAARQQARL